MIWSCLHNNQIRPHVLLSCVNFSPFRLFLKKNIVKAEVTHSNKAISAKMWPKIDRLSRRKRLIEVQDVSNACILSLIEPVFLT